MTPTVNLKSVAAFQSIAKILEKLDQDAAQQVVRWAADLCGMDQVAARPGNAPRLGNGGRAEVARIESSVGDDPEYWGESLPDLFSRASPVARSGPERALVVGYYLQYIEKADEFDAQTLNSRLKDLGYRLPNVTRTMEVLAERVPALAVQTKKEGKSQQARKKYKLTSEGKRAAESFFVSTVGS